MKFQLPRTNRAGTVVPLLLLALGIACFVGCTYFGWIAIVFQPLYLLLFVLAILIVSRYALSGWEYGITNPTKSLPAGKFQAFMLKGKRSVPYCDLDLGMAIALHTAEEDQQKKTDGTLPPFRRTFSFVRNLFAKDVYFLYIQFRDGNVRLKLEICDSAFLALLQERVALAKSLPPRSYEDEEEETDDTDTDTDLDLDLDSIDRDFIEQDNDTDRNDGQED